MISISLHVDPEMIPGKFLEWNDALELLMTLIWDTL